MTFKLSNEDWLQAEKALTGKPSGTKFDKFDIDPINGKKIRSTTPRNHSFVMIKHVIYALSNRINFLPEEGNDSIVKKGLTKNGQEFAIKIESANLKDETSDACQASILDHLYRGQGLRTGSTMRIKKKVGKHIITTNKKLYTVMEWRGNDLFSHLADPEISLSPTQIKILSLRACLLIQDLHKKKIIHGDLKAENLTAIIQGNNISLKAIDFDFAKLLKHNENFRIGKTASGTAGLVSLEILCHKRYSFLSDTYALAIIILFQIDLTFNQLFGFCFNHFCNLADEGIEANHWLSPIDYILERPEILIEKELLDIFAGMLHDDLNKRTDSSPLICYLCKKLLEDKTLDAEISLKKEFEEILFSYSTSSNDLLGPKPITLSFKGTQEKKSTPFALNEKDSPNSNTKIKPF